MKASPLFVVSLLGVCVLTLSQNSPRIEISPNFGGCEGDEYFIGQFREVGTFRVPSYAIGIGQYRSALREQAGVNGTDGGLNESITPGGGARRRLLDAYDDLLAGASQGFNEFLPLEDEGTLLDRVGDAALNTVRSFPVTGFFVNLLFPEDDTIVDNAARERANQLRQNISNNAAVIGVLADRAGQVAEGIALTQDSIAATARDVRELESLLRESVDETRAVLEQRFQSTVSVLSSIDQRLSLATLEGLALRQYSDRLQSLQRNSDVISGLLTRPAERKYLELATLMEEQLVDMPSLAEDSEVFFFYRPFGDYLDSASGEATFYGQVCRQTIRRVWSPRYFLDRNSQQSFFVEGTPVCFGVDVRDCIKGPNGDGSCAAGTGFPGYDYRTDDCTTESEAGTREGSLRAALTAYCIGSFYLNPDCDTDFCEPKRMWERLNRTVNPSSEQEPVFDNYGQTDNRRCTPDTPCTPGQGACISDEDCVGGGACGEEGTSCPWAGAQSCCVDQGFRGCLNVDYLFGQQTYPRYDNGTMVQKYNDQLGQVGRFQYNTCCGDFRGGRESSDDPPVGHKCNEGEGQCTTDSDCAGNLRCGLDNCPANWGDGGFPISPLRVLPHQYVDAVNQPALEELRRIADIDPLLFSSFFNSPPPWPTIPIEPPFVTDPPTPAKTLIRTAIESEGVQSSTVPFRCCYNPAVPAICVPSDTETCDRNVDFVGDGVSIVTSDTVGEPGAFPGAPEERLAITGRGYFSRTPNDQLAASSLRVGTGYLDIMAVAQDNIPEDPPGELPDLAQCVWEMGNYEPNLVYAAYGPCRDFLIGRNVDTGDWQVLDPDYAQHSDAILQAVRGEAGLVGWRPTPAPCRRVSWPEERRHHLCCGATNFSGLLNNTFESELRDELLSARTTIVETRSLLDFQTDGFSIQLQGMFDTLDIVANTTLSALNATRLQELRDRFNATKNESLNRVELFESLATELETIANDSRRVAALLAAQPPLNISEGQISSIVNFADGMLRELAATAGQGVDLSTDAVIGLVRVIGDIDLDLDFFIRDYVGGFLGFLADIFLNIAFFGSIALLVLGIAGVIIAGVMLGNAPK